MIGLGVVVLLTLVICLPFMRAVYWLGDEGILLRGAADLAAGRRIYTDIFSFDPPAGYLIMEAWIKLFGLSFLKARLFASLMIVGIAAFSYLACLEVSGSVVLAAFLPLAWVITSPFSWIVVVSHHWLATLFSMAACWLTLRSFSATPYRGRLWWAGLAGAVAGMAAMVVASCGLYAELATVGSFLGPRRQRSLLGACVAAGFAAPLLCLAYIIMHGEFIPAYNDIVRFTLNDYSAIQKVSYGNGLRWFYPNRYLLPLDGALALAALSANARFHVRAPYFRVSVLFALAAFLGLYPRPDAAHLAFTAPLALPLMAYGATWLAAGWGPRWRRVAFGLAVIWCMPGAVGGAYQGGKAMLAPTVVTAAGPVALLGEERNGGDAVFSFLASQPANAGFFFYPYMPLMSYLAERQQTGANDVFTPYYTTRDQYFASCMAVTAKAQWVVFDRSRMGIQAWRRLFPTMVPSTPDDTRAFEQAIEQNFTLTRRMGNFEIWRRTNSANDAACAAIIHGAP
jgi:hypothetical protein